MRGLSRIEVTGVAAAAVVVAGIAWYLGSGSGEEKAVLANVTTGSPQEQVNARIDRMKAMGKALGEVGKAVEGGDVSGTSENAQLILKTATEIPSLFPAGTGPGDEGVTKTRAKAEIWSKPDEFSAEAKKLEAVANKILAASTANDAAALGAAMGEVTPACKGCHDAFRAPPPAE
jgi:cytochrome c556